jgi:hypothetical protein
MAKKIIVAHTAGSEYYGEMQVLSTTAEETVVPGSVNLPVNTGISDPETKADPELRAYLNVNAKVILCNIDTPDPEEDLPDLVTSESWFTLLAPDAEAPWDYDDHQDFHLVTVDTEGGETPVCGNPHGLVRVGDTLVFNNFDDTKLYQAPISAIESDAGSGTGTGNVVPTEINLNETGLLDEFVYGYHGVSLVAKANSTTGGTDVFALYIDGPGGQNYGPSKLVRVRFDSSGVAGDLEAVTLAKNAIALDFVPGTDGIIATCLGGYQHSGYTNGVNSALQLITNVSGTFTEPQVSTLLTGDGTFDPETEPGVPISLNGNYDIRAFVVSANGNTAYLLCQSFDAHYHAYWRLFRVKGSITTIDNESISQAVTAKNLTEVDSAYGTFGNNWDLYFDDTHGMLIFSQGSKLRFSEAGDYSKYRLFEGGVLYDFGAVPSGDIPPANINVNSVLPLADLMAQAERGVFADNRLHRAHHAMKMAARAAAKASAAQGAAPADEEVDGEEGKK